MIPRYKLKVDSIVEAVQFKGKDTNIESLTEMLPEDSFDIAGMVMNLWDGSQWVTINYSDYVIKYINGYFERISEDNFKKALA